MELYQEFKNLLQEENLIKCLNWVTGKLKNGDLSIVPLYTQILTPALSESVMEYQKECENKFCSDDQDIYDEQNDQSIEGASILHEHIKTSIVRTIVENCFPYVLEEIEKNKTKKLRKKMIVTCPSDEYHELGARMISDFFLLAGFSVIYLGSNTPQQSFIAAIKEFKPEFVAISVFNPFHLVTTKKIIQNIRNLTVPFKIILGGNAFKVDKNAFEKLNADILAESYEDIVKIANNIHKEDN